MYLKIVLEAFWQSCKTGNVLSSAHRDVTSDGYNWRDSSYFAVDC